MNESLKALGDNAKEVGVEESPGWRYDGIYWTSSEEGISDYATLQKARSLCACFQDEEAAKLLSELKDRSEQVYIKAEALFQLAGLKRKQKELQQAKELYRLLVTDYSGSVYSIEAAKLYRDLEAGEQTEVNNL